MRGGVPPADTLTEGMRAEWPRVQEGPERAVVGLDGPFDLIRRWQAFLEVSGRANANTRRQYRRYMLSFLADVLKDPCQITEDDVVDWLADQDARGAMRGMVLRSLRSFYSWAEDRDLCRSPVKRLQVPKRKYGPAVCLTAEELAQLLVAAERLDPRARWAMQLMYATGARLGSLCALAPQDVRGDWVHFRVAKYDQPYGVPLGPKGQEAVARLLALLDYRPRAVRERPTTLVGVGAFSVWRWVHLAGEIAGVRASPHILRHTFGDRLAADPNVDQRTWATLMNHRDASLLRRYSAAHDERLQAAVREL